MKTKSPVEKLIEKGYNKKQISRFSDRKAKLSKVGMRYTIKQFEKDRAI